MAVYTQLDSQAMAEIIGYFDVGTLISAKGIAEGVSNSNWLIETTGGSQDGTQATAGGNARFILTVYEKRTNIEDLPFFLGLLDHLAAKRCPVPRTIHDRENNSYRTHGDKALALIEFLPGITVNQPAPEQAYSVGAALAQMHLAAADFTGSRANGLALGDWQALAKSCGADGLSAIHPELPTLIESDLTRLAQQWPRDLPRSVIHADLFPDNVLMIDSEVKGLIDFYFACTDITAYDVAVTHAAWCFSADGRHFDAALSKALLRGYESVRPLSDEEREALPILAQGAGMRFLMTRAYDWLNTPADALVTRKDPLAFAHRIKFYADPANVGIFSAC